MRHRLSVNVEALETKNLLSHMAAGIYGPLPPSGMAESVGAVVAPIGGGGISPVVGTTAPTRITTPAPPISVPVPLLETSMTTNQTTYMPGQVVQMTFTMTNDTNHAVSVPMGPSIDGFVITHNGQTVWRSNSGPQPEFVVSEQLAPGQSVTLTADWTTPASMTGTFVVHNEMYPNDTATFEIGTSPDVSPVASRIG